MWEGREIKCCTSKLQIFAYAKDQNKGIYLYDEAGYKAIEEEEKKQLAKDLKKINRRDKI